MSGFSKVWCQVDSEGMTGWFPEGRAGNPSRLHLGGFLDVFTAVQRDRFLIKVNEWSGSIDLIEGITKTLALKSLWRI